MKTSYPLVLLIALSTQAAAAEDTVAAGANIVDTSQWKCKFCQFDEGLSGTLDLGLGYVSDDSFKFGEYTGLNKQGPYLIGNADVRSRAKDGGYWNFNATDLGLDSRELRAESGRQGKYRLFLEYDELPHFISDSASTPFLGTGGDTLTLPPGWVRAGTTGGMTSLGASLHDVDLQTQRKRVGVRFSYIPERDWEYAVNVRHETKEGTMRIGGAFFFNSAQLIRPVDYVTDQVDVSATYRSATWQTRFAYYGSMFRDGNDALTWQNPFTALVAGADAGQLALPPDNEFHQLAGAVGYQWSERTRVTADLAVGRMRQDQNFLAPTLNPNLSVPALPRDSLEGRVDTLNANLNVLSDVSDRLRLSAAYLYDDRANKTPQATYNWVTTDTFIAAPRTNLPYSFTHGAFKLSADYRLTSRLKTSLGFDDDTRERTFQEADKTREQTVWGKFIVRARDDTDLTLKLAHADREVSSYHAVPQIDPPENPLLRKYNMANRTRDAANLRADFAARENVNLGFAIDVATDDYPDSTIGLTRGKDLNLSFDASAALGKSTNLNFFVNREEIKSTQVGSQAFATPDWSATNEDTITAAGVGLKHAAIRNKLDLGADYTASRSSGAIVVTNGVPTPFPDLVTRLDTVRLYTTYRLKDGISLYSAYSYEHYRTRDWTLEGVAPNTIPNVLTLGEIPPSYHVGVLALALRYKF